VPLCKLRTEEGARIPGRAFGLLRDFVADEEVQRCGPRRRIEVASVVHVVIGSVAIGRGPVLGERGAIDRRVGALSSRIDFDGGYAVPHEGILIASSEESLFGAWVGLIVYPLRRAAASRSLERVECSAPCGTMSLTGKRKPGVPSIFTSATMFSLVDSITIFLQLSKYVTRLK